MTGRVLGGFRWKGLHAVGWGLLALIVLNYVRSGFPLQRGELFFLGITIVWTIIALDVLVTRQFELSQLLSGGGLVLLVSFVLRYTTYDDIAIVTGDHQAFLSFVNELTSTGSIGTWGTYTVSPLLPIELGFWKLVLGIGVIDVRLVSVTVASLLPFLLAAAIYSATGNARVEMFTLLLSTPFVLFIRGAALAETEFLVLLWFALLLLLLLRSMLAADVRIYGLLLLVAGSAIFLHPFYAFVFATVIVGSATIRTVAVQRSNEPINVSLYILGITTGVLVAHQSLLTVQGFFAVSVITEFDFLEGGNLLHQILSPSGGLANSIQIASSSGDAWYSHIPYVRFLQVFMIVPLAAIGWFGLVIRRRTSDMALVFISTAMVLLALAGTVLVLNSNLGYRTYYFAGIAGVMTTALAMGRVRDFVGSIMSDRESHEESYVPAFRLLVNVLLVAALVSMSIYTISGPTSPVGNNVDPILGGDRFAITMNEFDSRSGLVERLPDVSNRYLSEFSENDIDVWYSPSNNSITCKDTNRMWDGQVIVACRPP